MDAFLAFVEGSDLSAWIRGDSMLAFPTIITLHTICMGFLAGASSAIDLRILGAAPGIPLASLRPFYPLMWLAFAVNAVTGVLMVIGYPTKQLTNPLFYIKLSLVAPGVWLVFQIGPQGFPPAESAHKAITPPATRLPPLHLAPLSGP